MSTFFLQDTKDCRQVTGHNFLSQDMLEGIARDLQLPPHLFVYTSGTDNKIIKGHTCQMFKTNTFVRFF